MGSCGHLIKGTARVKSVLCVLGPPSVPGTLYSPPSTETTPTECVAPGARYARPDEARAVSRVEVPSDAACIQQTQQSGSCTTGSDPIGDTVGVLQHRLTDTPPKAVSIRIRLAATPRERRHDSPATRAKGPTIAQGLRREDLPFGADGTVPDCSFDPHGIPSPHDRGTDAGAVASQAACRVPRYLVPRGGRAFSQCQKGIGCVFLPV